MSPQKVKDNIRKKTSKESRRKRLRRFPQRVPNKHAEAAKLIERKAKEVLDTPDYLRFATVWELEDLKYMSQPGSSTLFVEKIEDVRQIFDNLHERHKRWYDKEQHHPDNMPYDARAAYNLLFKGDTNLSGEPITVDDLKKHLRPNRQGEVAVKDYGKKKLVVFRDGELTPEAKERIELYVRRKARPEIQNGKNRYIRMTHIDHFLAHPDQQKNAHTALGKVYRYHMQNRSLLSKTTKRIGNVIGSKKTNK